MQQCDDDSIAIDVAQIQRCSQLLKEDQAIKLTSSASFACTQKK